MNSAQRRGLTRLMLRWPQRRTELRGRCGRDSPFLELSEVYEERAGPRTIGRNRVHQKDRRVLKSIACSLLRLRPTLMRSSGLRIAPKIKGKVQPVAPSLRA